MRGILDAIDHLSATAHEAVLARADAGVEAHPGGEAETATHPRATTQPSLF